MVYGTMAQIKSTSKTYSQRFESASGFETDPYTNTYYIFSNFPWHLLWSAWVCKGT